MPLQKSSTRNIVFKKVIKTKKYSKKEQRLTPNELRHYLTEQRISKVLELIKKESMSAERLSKKLGIHRRTITDYLLTLHSRALINTTCCPRCLTKNRLYAAV